MAAAQPGVRTAGPTLINRRERHEGVERNRRRKRDMVGRPGEARGKGVRSRVRKGESAISEFAGHQRPARATLPRCARRAGRGRGVVTCCSAPSTMGGKGTAPLPPRAAPSQPKSGTTQPRAALGRATPAPTDLPRGGGGRRSGAWGRDGEADRIQSLV